MTTPRLETYTLRDGHGTPLVLLHGFPLDHRMWEDVAAALPGEPTVLALDLPGLGQSPLGAEPPSLDTAADAVAQALHTAGVRRAVVAGLSMGGYVALALAERHRDLVAGLGLVDTKSTADTDEARDNRLRVADRVTSEQSVDAVLGMPGVLLGETSATLRPHLTARLEEWIRVQRPAGVAWSQRAMAARPDRTGVLDTFGGPVAVVVGEEDQVTPVAEAEHMASAARDAQLVQVPKVGHMSAVEEPAAVADSLADLLARATA
ncbi:alpha/beta fold hydrolase [Cellulosimicrobium marinum]|uniref:alpha/beta fold hydrolase n=1 Tax=Cellulosimicrobium marinum TaxID=1638992 RepID=UPI001E3E373F|nr:alpha/beta fold hydrolase [Cellulosimicrobium marinum]MCB7138037.1 alpha/beta fold hydrolase [Cellulosimicrobium marinum]